MSEIENQIENETRGADVSENDAMEVNAVLSQAAYKRGMDSKMKEVQKYYGDRFDLVPELSNKEHFIVYDNLNDRVHMAIRGTDITDEQGKRLKDLSTDALIMFGLQKMSTRYKQADDRMKKLVEQYGKDRVVVTGHSLGGTLASELVHKHDVEGHSFNRGGTHLTFDPRHGRVMNKEHRERAKKNHVYYSMGSASELDPLSLGTQMDILANHHVVPTKKLKKSEKGVVPGHSIYHFYPPKK